MPQCPAELDLRLFTQVSHKTIVPRSYSAQMVERCSRCGGPVKSGLVALSVWFLVACSTGVQSTSQISPSQVGLRGNQVTVPEGLHEAEVQTSNGKVFVLTSGEPSVSAEEGVAAVRFPIGARADALCQLYPKGKDPAAMFRYLVQDFEDRVRVSRLTFRDVSVVQSTPVAYINVDYSMTLETGPARGVVKVALQANLDRFAMCLHDEPGVEGLFERVAKRFFESPMRAPEVVPVYTQVWRHKIADALVGFESGTITPLSDGQRQVITMKTHFLPRSETEWMMQDVVAVETADADGRLLDGTWVKVENLKTAHEIKVQRLSPTRYSYVGEAHGKQLAGEFEAQGDVVVPDLFPERVRPFMTKDDEFEFAELIYVPSADPTRPIVNQYRRTANDARNVVRASSGPIQMDFLLDSAARLLHLDMRHGRISFSSDRIFEQGSL